MDFYLKKAPLVHVAIHLRYSQIPELTAPSSLMDTEITRKLVEVGFPEKIESKGQEIEIKADERKASSTEIYRFIFRAAGQRSCVVLTDSGIVLKTTGYETFDIFKKQFFDILEALDTTITGLSKSIIKSVGFRYTNLIAPKGGESLKDYLVSDVLPVKNIFDEFKNNVGIYQASAMTEENQTLNFILEEVLTRDNKVSKVLPNNLIELDQNAGLLINGHEHWSQMSALKYALLDIDHFYKFPESPVYGRNVIMDRLVGLHEKANNTFYNVITGHAKTAWEIQPKEE